MSAPLCRNPDNQVVAATYAELYLNSAQKNASWIQPTIANLDAEMQAHATTIRHWNWVSCC